jgi:hypothetical protein
VRYLGMLDLTGIQKFLFRNPELKWIAEASDRIEQLTVAGGPYRVEAANRGVEVIMAAGGNAAFLADTKEAIQATLRAISRILLEEGMGLEVIGCIIEVERDQVAKRYRSALRELERRKLTQARNADFVFSGLEAGKPLPREKQNAEQAPKPARSQLIEPVDPENMVCESTEQTDLIAVVSVDGIGMGEHLNDWLAEQEKSGIDDKAFIESFSFWSESLKKRWENAWKSAREKVVAAFPEEIGWEMDHGTLPSRSITLNRAGDRGRYYPCRRIYQGGDDMGFVCDARIALSLTTTLMHELESQPVPDRTPKQFRHLTVSAGVVFVDSHFPFFRSMHLAEEVRMKAKKRAIEAKDSDEDPAPSTLDWWLNRQGALERPKDLFEGASMKPYLLKAPEFSDALDWTTFDAQIMSGMWRTFADSRNKLKDLLAAAAKGEQGAFVRRLLQLRPLEGGATLDFLPKGFDKLTGFSSGETPLLDSAEVYDIHYSLTAGLHTHTPPQPEEEAK